MDGSKQDGGSGSGKDGKDSNSTKRRPSKWDQRPLMSTSQDQDGQPRRSGSGLPRQGGPTIDDLQKRTSRTADDGWGAPSSTQPAVTDGGWGTAPSGWGATTAPVTEGGRWGTPQTPTGDGGGWGRGTTGGWGRGAKDNRQGPMNAGQDGASQKAKAQGGAFIGPPPPPPPGAPPKGRQDATNMLLTAGLTPAWMQIPQMQGTPPIPPFPIMPPGWGQPASIPGAQPTMGVNQMGMRPPR